MFRHSPPGATPIEDISGLLPKHITTRKELNEVEFANVTEAMQKYLLGPLTKKKAPFTLDWLKKVHREMFGKVWSWAGKFRTATYNIGIPPAQIPIQLRQLLDDFAYWESDPDTDLLEVSARLHHRLVQIHPFPNGNGRWARLLTNIYLRREGRSMVRWPEANLSEESTFRKDYIRALQEADRGDIQTLMEIQKEHSR